MESFVKTDSLPEFSVFEERLNQQQGAFVSLKKDDQLRGCIGQILPSKQPLWQVVQVMAVAACSEDPRFRPVMKSELDKLTYEISVLSIPHRINDWRDIALGREGIIISKGGQAGVFLPQVAVETGWTLEEFLSQLCEQKAGLPPDSYKSDPNVELQVFTVQVF